MAVTQLAPARSTGYQIVTYLRAPLSFNDGVTGVVQVGTLPAGALVLRTYAVITTAFNATGNTMKIGTVASDASFGTGISTAAAGVITGGTALATSTTVAPTVDTPVIATYTSTGSGTAGAGWVVVEYLPMP
jgi:hypothetical protein